MHQTDAGHSNNSAFAFLRLFFLVCFISFAFSRMGFFSYFSGFKELINSGFELFILNYRQSLAHRRRKSSLRTQVPFIMNNETQ